MHPQVNANGSVLLSEIVGSIKLKVFLSGMPELRLGLNDRVLFELTGRKRGEGGAPGTSHRGPQRRGRFRSQLVRALCRSGPALRLLGPPVPGARTGRVGKKRMDPGPFAADILGDRIAWNLEA